MEKVLGFIIESCKGRVVDRICTDLGQNNKEKIAGGTCGHFLATLLMWHEVSWNFNLLDPKGREYWKSCQGRLLQGNTVRND